MNCYCNNTLILICLAVFVVLNLLVCSAWAAGMGQREWPGQRQQVSKLLLQQSSSSVCQVTEYIELLYISSFTYAL